MMSLILWSLGDIEWTELWLMVPILQPWLKWEDRGSMLSTYGLYFQEGLMSTWRLWRPLLSLMRKNQQQGLRLYVGFWWKHWRRTVFNDMLFIYVSCGCVFVLVFNVYGLKLMIYFMGLCLWQVVDQLQRETKSESKFPKHTPQKTCLASS